MKNKFFLTGVISLIALFIFTTPGFSQNRSYRSKERMDMVKKVKMLEMLELSEDTSEKFLAKYTVSEKKLDEKFSEIKIASMELKLAIDKKSNDIKSKTDKLISLRQEMHSLNLEKQKEVKSVLNEIDYAKFVLFEHNFFRELSGTLMNCGRDRVPNNNKMRPKNRK